MVKNHIYTRSIKQMLTQSKLGMCFLLFKKKHIRMLVH